MAKKTLGNCGVIKEARKDGLGNPNLVDGKCEGYASGEYNDEPYSKCQTCKLGVWWDVE